MPRVSGRPAPVKTDDEVPGVSGRPGQVDFVSGVELRLSSLVTLACLWPDRRRLTKSAVFQGGRINGPSRPCFGAPGL